MVEPCGDLLDRCLQLVVQHKLQKQVEALAALGFPAGAALAAVQQHRGNLEAAVTTLLEQVRGGFWAWRHAGCVGIGDCCGRVLVPGAWRPRGQHSWLHALLNAN